MFARSTTVIADPSLIDRGVALLREDIMPTLMSIDGCVGMSCLVERESGRCISTSSWQSFDAMQASEVQVSAQRNRMIDAFGAREPLVQRWEIPVMHRTRPAPPEAFARLTWIEPDPANFDNSIEYFKRILPQLDDLPGFCSASLLINRATGQAVSTALYDSFITAAQNRDVGQSLRNRLAQQTGARVLEVAEFELALAQLRVPELV